MENNIFVNIPVEKKEVELLKAEKLKLDELYNKVVRSKDELVNAKLSGKTNDACIKNNELFIKVLKQRVDSLDSLISKLDHACKAYEEEWNLTHSLLSPNDQISDSLIVQDGGKG